MNRNRLYKGTFNSEINKEIKGEIEMVARFNRKITITDDKSLSGYIKYTGGIWTNEIFRIEIEPLNKTKFLNNTPYTVAKKIHMGEFSSQDIEVSINIGSFPGFIDGKYASIKPADRGRFKISLTNSTDYSPFIKEKNNTECIIL